MAPPAEIETWTKISKWVGDLVAGRAFFVWYVAPFVFVGLFLLTSAALSARGRKRLKELERWLADFLGPLRLREPDEGPYRSTAGEGGGARLQSRRVRQLPEVFRPLEERVGNGRRLADIVLVPKQAYLAVRGASVTSSHDHQTVFLRLADMAPSFTLRPVPIVDGKPQLPGRVGWHVGPFLFSLSAALFGFIAVIWRIPKATPQTWFQDDPDFADRYFVEDFDRRQDREAIEAWLTPELREALCDLPGVWLQSSGKALAVTLYGDADASRLDELVGVADAFAAEHGAGEDALFPEEPPTPDKAQQAAPRPADPKSRILAAVIDYGLYAVAAAFVAATIYLGSDVKDRSTAFDNILGAPPADDGTGPWNGGWTPGGFGWFVLSELILVGLYVAQAYLASSRGKSIGKQLVGVRVERLRGGKQGFVRGVLLRSWLFWLLPIGGAAAFFAYRASGGMPQLKQLWPAISGQPLILIIAAVVVLADALSGLVRADGRCLHDLLAGTRVVFEPGAGGEAAAAVAAPAAAAALGPAPFGLRKPREPSSEAAPKKKAREPGSDTAPKKKLATGEAGAKKKLATGEAGAKKKALEPGSEPGEPTSKKKPGSSDEPG
ncbi:MAG: RDD family protein [Polyangiaceae bacterium]|nr:RDD family protein [Polyangiaceae bacterium]